MKKRKIERVDRHSGLYRILIFNEKSKKYQEPARGKKFLACLEIGSVNGKRKREKRSFVNFNEAKEFIANASRIKDAVIESYISQPTMLFKDLTNRWVSDLLPHLESTTQARYRSYLQHFSMLNSFQVEKIDSSTIDLWIGHVKRPEYLANLNSTRCSFDHELSVLRDILTLNMSNPQIYSGRINLFNLE